MKIIHVIFSMETGGSETMLVDILNEQVKADCAVELIIINKKNNTELINQIDKRVKITYFNRVGGLSSFWTALRFNLYILRFRSLVLHFHDHGAVNFVLLSNGRKILTVHAVGLEAKNWKKYDKLYSISKSVQADVEQRSAVHAALVYNGVDFEKIKKKTCNSESSHIKIVQVSRLDHIIKGQDVLIEALNILKLKEPSIKIKLDFIGEGSSLPFLQHLVSNYGLEKEVSFLGLKNRDYIYEHLCDYDLLVQPSNNEGFGLTVAEGIAAKIPVLIADNPGPMEIIDNGKFGFFFQKGNADDCASKILEIIKSDTASLTEGAYAYAYANFNIRTTANEYLKLYKQ